MGTMEGAGDGEDEERIISPAARQNFAWVVTACQAGLGGVGLYVGCGRHALGA